MAKASASPLLIAAFQPNAKGEPKPKKKLAKGENAATGGKATQVGESPASAKKQKRPTVSSLPMEAPHFKPPSPTYLMKDQAQREKVNATAAWVRGDMSSKEHAKVHDRANHVVRNAARYGSTGPDGGGKGIRKAAEKLDSKPAAGKKWPANKQLHTSGRKI